MGLGFVLHGLWPQDDSGHYPERCDTTDLSPEAVAVGVRIYPSPQLLRHEWETHGSCSGLDPVEYFRAADRAVAVVQIPAAFEAPDHALALTRADIEAAFASANPALPGHAMALECSHGQLSEVRICLTRSLAPRNCGRGIRSSCRGGPIEIPSSR